MAGRGQLSRRGEALESLREAARQRLLDADALLGAGRHASAMALGLYALEIELKVLICQRLDLTNLPVIFREHDLSGLMVHTGLSNKIRRVRRPRDVSKNWDELLGLPRVDEFRYGQSPAWDEPMARRVLYLLRGRPDGVIPWLQKQGSSKPR